MTSRYSVSSKKKKVEELLFLVINMWTLPVILLPFLLQNKFYSIEGYLSC